jgi:hypothetical protein
MIYKWLWALVRAANECNEYTLHLLEISLKRVQETACLKVFRGSTYGQPIILDDISQAIPICSDWTEAKQAQRRVTAV